MSTPINVLSKILAPLSNVLVATTSLIERRYQNKGYQISVDELSTALDLAGENDTNEEEKRILEVL